MSENNGTNNNTEQQQEASSREPVRISCPQKLEWDGTASSKFISAVELCRMVNAAFKENFYDFQGSVIDIPQNNQGVFIPTISLRFNHINPQPGETRYAGVTRNLDEVKEGANVTRNAIRSFNHTLTYGDKYYLSKEAKEAIGEYLVDSKNIHKKGDINKDIDWGKVVSDVYFKNYYFDAPNQMTNVSYIDPGKFFAEVYGGENKYVYAAYVISSLPYDRSCPDVKNYLLNVLRLDIAKVNELGMIFGLGQAGNAGMGFVSI